MATVPEQEQPLLRMPRCRSSRASPTPSGQQLQATRSAVEGDGDELLQRSNRSRQGRESPASFARSDGGRDGKSRA